MGCPHVPTRTDAESQTPSEAENCVPEAVSPTDGIPAEPKSAPHACARSESEAPDDRTDSARHQDCARARSPPPHEGTKQNGMYAPSLGYLYTDPQSPLTPIESTPCAVCATRSLVPQSPTTLTCAEPLHPMPGIVIAQHRIHPQRGVYPSDVLPSIN